MTSAYHCKDGKIYYSSFLLCLLSPNLDMDDELTRSRSSYFLKKNKTVREPPMMESLYIEINSFSNVHHVCFSINVTKFLSILSQKISYLAPRQEKRKDQHWLLHFNSDMWGPSSCFSQTFTPWKYLIWLKSLHCASGLESN